MLDTAKAQNAAQEILARCGIFSPPVDPCQIAAKLGLQVVFTEFKSNGEPIDTVSGFLRADDRTIYVFDRDNARRQLFTIAHEIGHFVMHSEWAKNSTYKVLLRERFEVHTDPIEREANEFAANLLMPEQMLSKYYKLTSNVDQLADVFAVSKAAMQRRVREVFGS
jgi:Zn-dependent peptidase ImmA (M78 family)